MADWEDLFAMAAGHQVHPSLNLGTKNSQDSRNETSRPPNRPEKRKRKRQTGSAELEFSRMIEGRMSIPLSNESTWPPWLRLGSSLSSKRVCPGWEQYHEKKSSEMDRLRLCRHCKRSPLHHRVQPGLLSGGKSNEQRSFALAMFAAVRNIRCCAKIIASSTCEQYFAEAQAIQNEAKGLHKLVQSSNMMLPAGEGSLLEAKCARVIELAHIMFKHVRLQKQNDSGMNQSSLEDCVRLIIACDTVYYRLYYLQITKALPICTIESGCSFLPHPSDYFRLPYLCWDVFEGERFTKEFISSVRKEFSNDSETLTSTLLDIFGRYGIDGSYKFRKNNNPLSALHHNRLMETVTLFFKSGYMASKNTKRQTLRALESKSASKDGLSCHETPAPQILVEWRDSCRDLLCNLYAYAALAHGTERRIRSLLTDHNMSGGLVELGAGTGYVSSLLQKAGIHVMAWDTLPTHEGRTMNEYHGSTPPFFNVQEVNVGTLKRHFGSGSQRAGCVALLLCYAPPQSFMARDALQTYMDAGGQCLIHIGEFRGLTGSAEFESLLTKCFECVDRMPCLTWGTDASEVTCWIRTDSGGNTMGKDSSSRFLLPCSNCGNLPAAKRCRLVRFLVYCGDQCFRAHERERGIAISLALNSTSLAKASLEFDNDNHFVPLESSFDTRAQSGVKRYHDDNPSRPHNKQRNKRRKRGRS